MKEVSIAENLISIYKIFNSDLKHNNAKKALPKVNKINCNILRVKSNFLSSCNTEMTTLRTKFRNGSAMIYIKILNGSTPIWGLKFKTDLQQSGINV